MDFATLPPEINSGLMYSGPGAGSMVAAAAAWDKLAAWLCTAAADYRAVTAKLAAHGEGPACSALREAAALYVDWLDANAARSQRAAAQLSAAPGRTRRRSRRRCPRRRSPATARAARR
jgi:PPE-repeat protein